MVNWRRGTSASVTPRTPIFYAEDQDADALPGYVALNEDNLWSEERERDLPDHWWEYRAAGPRIKRDYRPYVPQRLIVAGDGSVGVDDSKGSQVWFQLSPFLLCLRCGVAYDRTEKNDFRKLTRLSHTGRSTATTLVSGSAIVQLRNDAAVKEEARKLLSFTDNRQDGSLQAGHFNGFIQVALVRAALFRALTESETLDHATVTQAVFRALDLQEELYALQPAGYGPGKDRNEVAMHACWNTGCMKTCGGAGGSFNPIWSSVGCCGLSIRDWQTSVKTKSAGRVTRSCARQHRRIVRRQPMRS